MIEKLYHGNGELAARGELDSLGRKEGLWRFAFPDGAEQGHARFAKGVRHGEFVELHACGKLKERSHYRHGRRSGRAMLHYRSGQTLFDGAVLPVPGGLLERLGPDQAGGEIAVGDGRCKIYFPNGVRCCRLLWVNGVIADGLHTFRFENDEIDHVLSGRWRRGRRITWLGKPVPGVPPVTHFDFDHFRRLDDPSRPPVERKPIGLVTECGNSSLPVLPTPAIELPSPAVEDGMRDYF